jgi:hypothetical protein
LDINKVTFVALKRRHQVVSIPSPLKLFFVSGHNVFEAIFVYRSPNREWIANRNGVALPAPYFPACFEISSIAAEVGAKDTRPVPAPDPTPCASPFEVTPKREFL